MMPKSEPSISDFNGIINRFKSSAPVDLLGLAAALGIEVLLDRSLPQTVSGKIERGAGQRVRVTLNASYDRERQRLTLAHEIGHLALHREKIDEGIVDDTWYHSQLSDLAEQAANHFALELLMPEPLVRQKWRGGANSIVELAVIFNVPVEAAKLRMAILKLP